MKFAKHLLVVVAAAAPFGLAATPVQAMAVPDGWTTTFTHSKSGSCDSRPPDCGKYDHCEPSKSVPEIDPAGLTAFAGLLAGGALLLASRRRTKKA